MHPSLQPINKTLTRRKPTLTITRTTLTEPKTALAGVMLETSFARFKASMAALNAEVAPSRSLGRWDVSVIETETQDGCGETAWRAGRKIPNPNSGGRPSCHRKRAGWTCVRGLNIEFAAVTFEEACNRLIVALHVHLGGIHSPHPSFKMPDIFDPSLRLTWPYWLLIKLAPCSPLRKMADSHTCHIAKVGRSLLVRVCIVYLIISPVRGSRRQENWVLIVTTCGDFGIGLEVGGAGSRV